MTFLNTLKARDLKNQPRNYWKMNGFHVQHLSNGYWLTAFNYSDCFKTMGELKNYIRSINN